jgi:hypothetical protein
LKNNFLKINSVFLDCVANSDRIGQELKVAGENLKKDLRGKNNMDLLFEIVLANFNRMKWFSNLN